MKRFNGQKGNTLVFTIATLGIVAVLIFFFAINYSQLTSTHKEGQTAIDAAALQAANDMSKVVVDSPLGRLALVDDQGTSNTSYPVQGFNTVAGTLRLDALIASRLGNTTLAYLVKQDITNLQQAATLLKGKFLAAAGGSGTCFDKSGNVVNIRQNALTAYTNNSRRMANKSSTSQPTQFTLSFGTLTSADKSGIPIPTPTTGDPVTFNSTNSYTDSSTGQTCYKSGTDFAVPGLANTNMRFCPVASSPSLIDNSKFTTAMGNLDLPSVVQISAVEQVSGLAKGRGGKNATAPTGSINVIASAQAGGRMYLPPSGTLTVSFAGPVPNDPGGSPLSFKSVTGIMNASQLNPSNANPTSSYTGWNAASAGTWRAAKGGPVPGAGSLQAQNFKGLSGRNEDDPSVSLAMLTYDWLRTLTLRPNVNSMVTALNFDFRSYNSTSTKQFAAFGSDFMQPTYAAGPSAQAETSGILQIKDDGDGDPRNLTDWDAHPDAYQRQQARMWGYIPGDGVLPADTELVKIAPDGDVTTVDGNPANDLNELEGWPRFA
jgi:hypothetical protein